ncbi:MAG: TIGR03792 family protein [Prochlorococcaceae cyanobacterium]
MSAVLAQLFKQLLSLLGVLTLLAAVSLSAPPTTAAADGVVVEQLRLRVPTEQRQAWLEAERGSWEPFLARQDGFLGRELFWDPARQEALLLIRWASRAQWQAIPAAELQQVQERFERIARQGTGLAAGNPFPLVFEGELEPQ